MVRRRGGTLNTARRTFRPDLRRGAAYRVRLPGRKPNDPYHTSVYEKDALETRREAVTVALQQIRAGQSVPAGHFKPWRFCPWCGRAARTARIDE